MITRVDVHEASVHMLSNAFPLGTEATPLGQALGRVLAQDVVSPVSLPPRDNASMDGFAVHSEDIRGATAAAPAALRVIGAVAAGAEPLRAIRRGEAVRIMTGAATPNDADCVVRVEDTRMEGDVVFVLDDRDADRNIRQCGEDVRAGQVVMRPGTWLRAPHLGVLASIGCAVPILYRRPLVAILATGDELVPMERFHEVLGGGRIVSSNSYALAAAVREAGGEPVSLGIALDDPVALAEHLREAQGCDLVLTSGGVSVGDFDFTRDVVTALGGELSLWRVRMRPGAPIAFGSLFGVPWLGLPGNPVSALVTFELFGRPLIRTLAGFSRAHRRTIAVRLADALTLGAPLTHFLRVVIERGSGGELVARLTGAQSSGMLTSMSSADALLIVPPEPREVAAGTWLRAIPLDGDFGGSERFLA